jgi:hypothetical protein
MFKKLLAATIATVAVGAVVPSQANAQQANTLTAQEKADGWKLLFNGRNLDGWHSYLQKGPAKDWKVQDGAIMLERSRTGNERDFADLVTDAQYSNFDLKLEWKMTPCADSGVMFYVHESPKYQETYETGPEMQIADLTCTQPDSHVDKERSGDLFDLIASDVERVHEAGNWNQFEIIADHGHIQFFQNGSKVVDTYFWNDDWRKLVAQSKFAQWADFGTFKTGHISIQGTEDKGELPIHIWFRNIKLKQL